MLEELEDMLELCLDTSPNWVPLDHSYFLYNNVLQGVPKKPPLSEIWEVRIVLNTPYWKKTPKSEELRFW